MSDERLTHVLGEIRAGRAVVTDDLLPLVYDELRGVARGMMRGQPETHTLEPTALVNEVCVKMLGGAELTWQNRAHFFAVAAIAMRQVLATHARNKRAAKRSATGGRVTLSGLSEGAAENNPLDVLALDDALSRLAAIDPRQAQLVELRFLAGMTVEEAAFVMGISVPTAEREWRVARAMLRRELSGEGGQ